MSFKNAVLSLSLTVLTIPVLAQTSEPRLIVSATKEAAYRTIQDAIDHAPSSGATILIEPGTYKEKIQITKPGIRLVGKGDSPSSVILTYGDSAKSTGSTFRSATVMALADSFEAENLSIVNSWWDEHPDPADASQAVALNVVSDRAVLDHVRLISGQDTLYASSSTCRNPDETSPCHASRQLYNDIYIEGNVDYIFGDARAVFNDCELHSRPHPFIAITAQSKHFPASDSAYYFLHCAITGRDAGDSVVLGRPWRTYSTVLFYDTDMKQKLSPEGWSEWEGRLKTSTYREYRSHGPGVNPGHRAVDYPPLAAEEEATFNSKALLSGDDKWNPDNELKLLRSLAK
jgi:pectin methylesterase-like acyl-CoA thioesterase